MSCIFTLCIFSQPCEISYAYARQWAVSWLNELLDRSFTRLLCMLLESQNKWLFDVLSPPDWLSGTRKDKGRWVSFPWSGLVLRPSLVFWRRWLGVRKGIPISGKLLHVVYLPKRPLLERQEKENHGDTGQSTLTRKTSSSAIAEGPRDALSQLKSCQLLHNCTKNHIW